MTQSLHPAAEKGFRSAAELYQQVRPSYPHEIISWLKQQLQLNAQSKLIDLGAGTGKFLPYLQEISTYITAVEPIQEMLTQLQQNHPHITTCLARSDQLPLATQSINAVICAQSFHWFSDMESLREIARVLTPQGHLGLIWNQRDVTVDWVNALAKLIAPLEGDTPRYHHGLWQKVLEDSSLFHLNQYTTFRLQHTGTVEQVVSKRLLSTSFIAALPNQKQQELKQQFEKIVLDYTGKQAHEEITFPYVTYAYDFQKLTK